MRPNTGPAATEPTGPVATALEQANNSTQPNST